MSETLFVYALCEPGTEIVRYVGVSEQPEKRINQHIIAKRNAALVDWLKQIKAQGLLPSLLILETFDNHWSGMLGERRWIHHYLAQQAQLFNKMLYPTSNGTVKAIKARFFMRDGELYPDIRN